MTMRDRILWFSLAFYLLVLSFLTFGHHQSSVGNHRLAALGVKAVHPLSIAEMQGLTARIRISHITPDSPSGDDSKDTPQINDEADSLQYIPSPGGFVAYALVGAVTVLSQRRRTRSD